MPRGPAIFTQAEVTRAAKGVRAAGLEVVRTEIDRDGRIVIVSKADTVIESADAQLQAYMSKKAKR